MDTENDNVDTEADTEDSTTDYKAKYAELGIRTRERTKALKDQLASKEAELADIKKATKSETKEIKSEFGLLEKAYLRASGVNDPDKVELLKKWQKDTGKGIEELVDHPFIKAEFEKLDQAKANQLATSKIQSDAKDGAKDDVEHWLSKGELPERIPANKKLRQKILIEKLRREKDGSAGGKFYND